MVPVLINRTGRDMDAEMQGREVISEDRLRSISRQIRQYIPADGDDIDGIK